MAAPCTRTDSACKHDAAGFNLWLLNRNAPFGTGEIEFLMRVQLEIFHVETLDIIRCRLVIDDNRAIGPEVDMIKTGLGQIGVIMPLLRLNLRLIGVLQRGGCNNQVDNLLAVVVADPCAPRQELKGFE